MNTYIITFSAKLADKVRENRIEFPCMIEGDSPQEAIEQVIGELEPAFWDLVEPGDSLSADGNGGEEDCCTHCFDTAGTREYQGEFWWMDTKLEGILTEGGRLRIISRCRGGYHLLGEISAFAPEELAGKAVYSIVEESDPDEDPVIVTHDGKAGKLPAYDRPTILSRSYEPEGNGRLCLVLDHEGAVEELRFSREDAEELKEYCEWFLRKTAKEEE